MSEHLLGRNVQELRGAMLHEQQPRDDTQHTAHLRRPSSQCQLSIAHITPVTAVEYAITHECRSTMRRRPSRWSPVSCRQNRGPVLGTRLATLRDGPASRKGAASIWA